MPEIVHALPLRGVTLAIAAAGMLAADIGEARANASAGCDAANRGSLNTSVAAGQSTLRQATLAGGETLTFSIATRARAALAVESGEGAARTLHAGPAASVLFVAPQSGSYGFRVEAAGGADAAVRVTCTSVARAEAERALVARRKAFLAGRDPDRIRIDRPAGEPKLLDSMSPSADGAPPRDVTASISISEIAAAMNPGQKKEPGILDFWFEGRHLTYDTVDANANDGSFAVMYFGSKYMLGPDIMLGALAQFDRAGEGASRLGNQVSARGWMAGPYVSMKFGPGVIFDGRAAWGVADNGLPRGVALDMAPADRRLYRGTLRGNRQLGGWTFAPSVGLSYVEDTPAMSFSDAEPVGTGRLDMLPELKRRFNLDGATYIEPRVAAGGFLSFDDISELRPGGAAAAAPDLHWKAEAGVALGVKDSVNLEATGGVETGGEAEGDTWSGRLQLNMPLGK